jgi:ParB/RepB/Spo0J family partition protein
MSGTSDRYPDSFDALVDVSELKRGKHNVRNATPAEHLKSSIEMEGIKKPLLVRDAGEDEKLHITDGWQRYQAAVALGWQQMPVNIYTDTLDALRAADALSITDDWTRFHMARHCQSLMSELQTDGLSYEKAIEKVADETSRSAPTVRRYMNAFRLPDLLHPLLKNSSNVTEMEWTHLQNHKPDVRRYSGLSWQVAAKAGSNIGKFDDEVKLINAVLETLEYDADEAKTFLQEFVDDPGITIDMARHSVFDGPTPTEKKKYRVPRIEVTMNPETKELMIDHLTQQKTFIGDKVESLLKDWAEELEDKNRTRTLDEYERGRKN